MSQFTIVNQNKEIIFCPVCGDDTNQKLIKEEPPCSHLLYATTFGDSFLYMRQDVANLFEKISEEFDFLEELEEQGNDEELERITNEGIFSDTREGTLIERLDSKYYLHLGLRLEGMACGPTSYTTYLGFDFEVYFDFET